MIQSRQPHGKRDRQAIFERIRGVRSALVEGHHDENGFTLIELLIVIVVLGILAAITVFGLSGTTSQSAVSACKADARTVEVAVDAYHSNDLQGNWPGDMTALTSPNTGPNTSATPTPPTQPPSESPYLRSAPFSTHYTIAIGTMTGVPGGALAGSVWVLPTGTVSPGNFDTNLYGSGTQNICELVK